jgi:hypothetical protein
VRIEVREERGACQVVLETPIGAPRAGVVANARDIAENAFARDPSLAGLARSIRENRAIWENFFTVYDLAAIRLGDGAIVATRERPFFLPVEEEAASIRRLVGRLAHVTRSESTLCLRGRATSDERCPVCHDKLMSGELAVCHECGTRHHDECLRELGRCATFGCARGEGPRRARWSRA